jgi:glycosyltransferase involved in cell wall biosynthesis
VALAQSAYVRPGQIGGSIVNYSVWPWVEPISEIADPVSRAAWPKISIVTPNFNYGHLIEATLRSVLMQNYPNLEYIVIDGDSTDDSVKVIKKYESKLGYFEHRQDEGQYHAINKGFSKATGEIFGWLNSDDIYLPWTLHVVARIFTDFPEVDWIIGHPSTIQDGIVHYIPPSRPFPRAMIKAGLFHGCAGGFGWIQQESCFWRRGLWEKAGGLDESLRYAADFELWTKFAKFAELYSVSTLLGGFSTRGTGNRSFANIDRYGTEVDKVNNNIRIDPNSLETVLARKFLRFKKFNGSLGMSRITRRVLSLPDLYGPVLDWDSDRACYNSGKKRFLA